MKIVKIDFKKDKDNKILLRDKENIEKLRKWVFPIIGKNKGWGTGGLTIKNFLSDPEHFQDDIDATVEDNVHILLHKTKPAALLEFSETSFKDLSRRRHKLLNELLKANKYDLLNEFTELKFEEADVGKVVAFLSNMPIYKGVGIVVRPDLQGEKTGLTEKLYEIVSDGILFGWTNNPIIVRQRKKIFKNTLLFPLYSEKPNSIEDWAVCFYVLADRLIQKNRNVNGLEFGTMYSEYFVEDRGQEYEVITDNMTKMGKLSDMDSKKLKYTLSKKHCANAIVSWN